MRRGYKAERATSAPPRQGRGLKHTGLRHLQWPFAGYRRAPCREQWHWWAWVFAWGVLGLALAVWAG